MVMKGNKGMYADKVPSGTFVITPNCNTTYNKVCVSVVGDETI